MVTCISLYGDAVTNGSKRNGKSIKQNEKIKEGIG